VGTLWPVAYFLWSKVYSPGVDLSTDLRRRDAPPRGRRISANNLAAGSLLVVSDVLEPERIRIAPQELRDAERNMGEVALRALDGGS
jgi:hypothetical protein